MRPLFLLLLASCAPDFTLPSGALARFEDLATRLSLPAAGPRPSEFECVVETVSGTLTVTSDGPDFTVFELEGFVPVRARTVYGYVNGAMNDGTEVYVIGDLLVVGERVFRVGECPIQER